MKRRTKRRYGKVRDKSLKPMVRRTLKSWTGKIQIKKGKDKK